MSRLLRGRRGPDSNPAAKAGPETVNSRLLPLIMEQLEQRQRLHVLDLGSGSQSTLNFFAGRNAAIHFVDLFSCDLVLNPAEMVNTAAACDQILVHLRLPEGLVFDVCVFWDVLHYLPLPSLEGLSRSLAPHLSASSLGYALIMITRSSNWTSFSLRCPFKKPHCSRKAG